MKRHCQIDVQNVQTRALCHQLGSIGSNNATLFSASGSQNSQIFQNMPLRCSKPQTKIQKSRPTAVKTTSTGPQGLWLVQLFPKPQLCHKNLSWNQLTRFCLAFWAPHVIVCKNHERTPQHSEKTKNRMQFDPSHWNGLRMLLKKRPTFPNDADNADRETGRLWSHSRKSRAYIKMPVPVVKRLYDGDHNRLLNAIQVVIQKPSTEKKVPRRVQCTNKFFISSRRAARPTWRPTNMGKTAFRVVTNPSGSKPKLASTSGPWLLPVMYKWFTPSNKESSHPTLLQPISCNCWASALEGSDEYNVCAQPGQLDGGDKLPRSSPARTTANADAHLKAVRQMIQSPMPCCSSYKRAPVRSVRRAGMKSSIAMTIRKTIAMRCRMPMMRTVLRFSNKSGPPSVTWKILPCTAMPSAKRRNTRNKTRKKMLLASCLGRILTEMEALIPEMNKKYGITKSAKCKPFHGACPMVG